MSNVYVRKSIRTGIAQKIAQKSPIAQNLCYTSTMPKRTELTVSTRLMLENMRNEFMTLFHNTEDDELSEAIDMFVETIFTAERMLSNLEASS